MPMMKALLDKISKMGWYISDMPLPEGRGVVNLNFVIHSEVLYDEATCAALGRFSRDFHELTRKRIVVCISTPLSFPVRKGMSDKNVTEERFISNLRDLSRYAEIGYHGHFYIEHETGQAQMSSANYDGGIVERQIGSEIGWLKGIGFTPLVYVAGWWFLKPDTVRALEHSGIKVDCSVRRFYDDTFGGRYLKAAQMPGPGRPFLLPPSGEIVEIESVFGPVMRPSIMKRHLMKYLAPAAGGERFLLFPLHDWDIPRHYANIWANVVELGRFRNSVRWMDVMEMRDAYLRKDTVKR